MENDLEQRLLARWDEEGVPGDLNDVRAAMDAVEGSGKFTCKLILVNHCSAC